MVNETLTESFPMTAALKYMRRVTDRMFESQMRRAAVKICERQRYFRRPI
jgi:hypothetical protein